MSVKLSLAVQYASASKTLPERAQVRRWASAACALARESMNVRSLQCEITIRYVDEKEGRELNRSFRGKDYATNVLTFANDAPPPSPKVRHSSLVTRHCFSDIAICAPVVAREAKAQKKTAHAHHAHMVIHGMLHALGFDHENDGDAEAMEAIEIAVLSRFRINNPYA